MIAAFSKFSESAILQVKYISVGISIFIMYLLYHYNTKVLSGFKLTSMKLKRLLIILVVTSLTFGKEIYKLLGIERTPIFDISTVNVLLISFFIIFSTGKKMTKPKFIFDAIITLLYVLCVGKAQIISSIIVLNVLRVIMLVVSIWGIRESFLDCKKINKKPIKNIIKEEVYLFLFIVICSIPAILLCKDTFFYMAKGYVSSLISFGGGEAYLTIAESMFLDNEILDTQLYSQLLPVTNALPGSVLTKLLSGIGYYLGLNQTGSVLPGIIIGVTGFSVAISASGAVVCMVMYIYEIFEDLKIFDLLRKSIKPIVGGLLISTSLSLLNEVVKIMMLVNITIPFILAFVGITLVGIFLIKKYIKLPDSVIVILCGCVSLFLCNAL